MSQYAIHLPIDIWRDIIEVADMCAANALVRTCTALAPLMPPSDEYLDEVEIQCISGTLTGYSLPNGVQDRIMRLEAGLGNQLMIEYDLGRIKRASMMHGEEVVWVAEGDLRVYETGWMPLIGRWSGDDMIDYRTNVYASGRIVLTRQDEEIETMLPTYPINDAYDGLRYYREVVSPTCEYVTHEMLMYIAESFLLGFPESVRYTLGDYRPRGDRE